MIVSGKISVKAILESKKRKIHRVILLEGLENRDVYYIQGILGNCPVEYMSREAMDELTGTKSHGGYAIDCEKRISDSLDALPSKGSLSLMSVEGMRDPYNLGEILRTALSMGFDGIVTSDYDFYEHEAKLIRASAGASEKLWFLQSEDIVQDLKALKKKGITLVAAHRDNKSIKLQDYRIDDRVCFVLGGSLRGLSSKVRSVCDLTVKIDYKTRTALSTVGACTVFAYEHFRQKGE